MNKKPLISVLMPVFNSEKYLKEAIKSVLEQTVKDFELIIIDDGSTDQSYKTIKQFKDKRIKVIKNQVNLGVSKSLNKGLAVAKGEFIARVDADDINDKNRFKKQIRFLKKNPEVVLVGSNAELINEKGKSLGVKKYAASNSEIRKEIYKRNPILHPAVMIRTETIKKVGGYSNFLNGAEDYDLFFKLADLGKLANLKEVLVKRRIHSEVITKKRHWKIELLAIIVRIIHLPKLLNND